MLDNHDMDSALSAFGGIVRGESPTAMGLGVVIAARRPFSDDSLTDKDAKNSREAEDIRNRKNTEEPGNGRLDAEGFKRETIKPPIFGPLIRFIAAQRLHSRTKTLESNAKILSNMCLSQAPRDLPAQAFYDPPSVDDWMPCDEHGGRHRSKSEYLPDW